MTADERATVAAALELSGESAAAAVASMTSHAQLHLWLHGYNVNDGLLPCLALARHALCDRGTALRLYWQLGDALFEPPLLRAKPPAWDARALLAEIDARLARDDFRTAELYFDPIAALALSAADQQRLVAQGVPVDRLQPIGHVRVEPLDE